MRKQSEYVWASPMKKEIKVKEQLEKYVFLDED